MGSCYYGILQQFDHDKKTTEPEMQLYEKIITDLV